MLATLVVIFILATAGPVVAKSSPDFQKFVTEPEFTAVTIDILQNERPDEQAPGLIFLAPYKGHDGWGPQIFDTSGNLVWHGLDDVKIRAIDLHPCLFNSTEYDHLCYNDAVPFEQGGHSVGYIRFFNNNYTQVGQDYGNFGDLRGPDIHELNSPPATQGKTFLQDIFQIRNVDLRPYKGPQNGYMLDGCFQEIDILSRKVAYQWCSLDHTDIDLTYIYLNGADNYTIPGLAGSGTRNAPWDYFHINSVDKSSAGDYVVSSRHANAILHIAGPDTKSGFKPGQVIWYLGGKRNSFKMEAGLNFSAQHTIRYYKDKTDKGMQVSLLNNAYEGHTKTSKASSGMLIDLDTEQMRASLISRFVQPSAYLSHDQGNLQMLPNGNGLMGWGHCNYFSEHDPSGKLLYYAQFGGKGDCDKDGDEPTFFVSSFRAWKFPWKGYPVSSPKIAAFAKDCASRTNVFMSWNGATEVASWAIYASNSSQPEQNPDSFKKMATVLKAGFETKATIPFSLYVYAEPLDNDDQPMRLSSKSKLFVPSETTACKNALCMGRDDRLSLENDSIAESCLRGVKVYFESDESRLMVFKFPRYGFEGAVLVGLCLPFALVYSLVVWSRHRWPVNRTGAIKITTPP